MRDGIQFVQDEFSKAYSNVLGKTIEEANEVIDRTEKIILYQLKNLLKE